MALVGEWSIDAGSGTTVADSSGNNNTGTINGGAVWTTGQYSNALDFDGTNDYVDIPTVAGINITGSAMTVMAWFKADTTTGALRIVSMPGSETGGSEKYALLVNGGQLQFWTKAGGGAEYSIQTAFTDTTNWHHACGVYNDAATNSMVLYLDGTQVAQSNSQAGNIDSNTNGKLQFGRYGPTYGQYFNGKIDEVRIYSHALTSTEVNTAKDTPIGVQTVTPNNQAQAQTLGAPAQYIDSTAANALTQAHSLATPSVYIDSTVVNALAQAQALVSPSVYIDSTIVDSASQAQALASPTTFIDGPVIDQVAQAQSLGQPTLLADGTSVNALGQAQALEAPNTVTDGTSVNESSQAQLLGVFTLSTDGTAVDSAAQAQVLGAPVTITDGTAVNALTQSQTASQPTLLTDGTSVDTLTQPHSISEPAVSSAEIVEPVQLLQTQTLAAPTVAGDGTIVQDLAQSHSLAAITVLLETVTADNLAQAQALGVPVLLADGTAVNALNQAQVLETPSVLISAVSVDSAAQTQSLAVPVLVTDGTAVNATNQAQALSIPGVTGEQTDADDYSQNQVLSVPGVFSETSIDLIQFQEISSPTVSYHGLIPHDLVQTNRSDLAIAVTVTDGPYDWAGWDGQRPPTERIHETTRVESPIRIGRWT